MSFTLPTMLRALIGLASRPILNGGLAIGLVVALAGAIALAPASSARAAGTTATRHRHHRIERLGRAAPGVAQAMQIAVRKKGDPYVYGADGPNAFDCSGLTYFSYRHAGFKHIPRTADSQSHFAKRIRRHNMHRGDLIFFFDHGRVYHVGLFAGFKNGHRMILHAPHPGQRVHTERLWTSRWFPGTLRYR